MKSERVAYPIFGASGLVNLGASLAIPAMLCRKTDHNLQIKIHRAHGFKFLILLNHRPAWCWWILDSRAVRKLFS